MTLVFALGSFGMAFGADTDAAASSAAVPSDVAGTDCEEAVTNLTSLGIISGYEDGMFRPDKTITRAEITRMLIAALEMDDTAIADLYSSSFSDVSSNWAKGYIGYANKLGFASGYADKSFKPGQKVTGYEAVTMIVRALGYKDVTGTWPANYEAKAIEIGLLAAALTNGSEPATRGEVAVLLDAALDIAIAGNAEDTMTIRLTGADMTYEAWQIPYGERLINEYGLEGAVTDCTPTIADSDYWQTPDYYNATCDDTLTILTHFKTQQQATGWTCGPSSALMNLAWYGMLGDLNERDLAYLRENQEEGATSLGQMVNIYENLENTTGQKWDLYSTFDADLTWGDDGYPYVTYEKQSVSLFDWIPMVLAEGKPIIVGWNDWGGHYQVIIGYDNMGTEITADDILVLADPYDTTDHCQDGYITQSFERFVWDWSAGWDPDFTYGIFLVATPEGVDGTELVQGAGIANDNTNRGDFTNGHMIPYTTDLADDIAAMSLTEPYASVYTNWIGADGLSGPASADCFRMADYKYSPYYKNVDVYDLKSNSHRTILEGYRSTQQATEYTCGVTSILGVLDYYDLSAGYSDVDLAALRNKTDELPGTTIAEMLTTISQLPGEWDVVSSNDLVENEDSYFGSGIEVDGEFIDAGEIIPYYIEKGIPVMVMWHEWGGHYQTVIGYDTMGTEGTCDDVLLMMDSYDTTDHNQDGYVVESYERLIYDWGNTYDEAVPWGAFVVMSPAE